MTVLPFQSDAPNLPGAEMVRVEETVDGVRYILPGRLLGGGHVFGAALALAGVVVVLAGGWWGAVMIANGTGSRLALALGVITPLLVVLLGLGIWIAGTFIAVGRTELLFHGTKLHRIERAGWLRWTSRQPIRRLARLRIEQGVSRDQSVNEVLAAGSANGSITNANLSRLTGEYESGRSAALLIGYPQEWLEAIARDLAHRLDLHPAHEAKPIGTGSHTEVVIAERQEARGAGGKEREPAVKPADSAIEVTKTREGLTIAIPPLRLLRDRKGALSLGAMWNGMMAFVTGGMFAFMHAPWQINLGIAAFWVISMGAMFVAVAVGRRSAIIDVVNETLLITQRSFIGVKQRAWDRDELRSIECASSGMEVNEQPVMQLQITPASGGTAAFFTGRDEEELRWLAHLLRGALQLPGDREKEDSLQKTGTTDEHG